MKQQQIVEEVVMRGLRPRFPPGAPRGYVELAQACWSGAATSRPTFDAVSLHMRRVVQNRLYTPYVTVYSVISLPKIPYSLRIHMVLANPTYAHPCF
jgi:hypothetical protein